MAAEAWQHLRRLVDAGDVAGCVRTVAGLEEKERRAIAKLVREHVDARSDGIRWPAARGFFGAASVVEFGCATPARAVAEPAWFAQDEVEERLVRSRPRKWRDEWAQRVADARGHLHWRLMRTLVREGACDRPEGDGYLIGAFNGMRGWAWRNQYQHPIPFAGVLRDDPEFLGDELWRLFEIEGAGDFNFTNADELAADDQKWSHALVELAAEGVVPRDRLLDASLAALRRDFTPYVARWHRQLHEMLDPTVDEHAARESDLLALLASQDGALVGFAVRSLGALEKAGRVDAARLLEQLAPAVLAPQKTHALRAAKLAARVLRRHPALAATGARALLDALVHEARDVQEVAVEALERHRDALPGDVVSRAGELAEAVDPALRARLVALAGVQSALPGAATPAPAPPPARSPDRLAPRLDAAEPLTPVRDLDDLLDRAAVVLERDDEPEEIELVLDGIMRFCDRLPDDGRARALARRAAEIVRWTERDTARLLESAATGVALPVLVWLGEAPRRIAVQSPLDSPLYALTRRIGAVLAAVRRRRPHTLAAVPTHRGGWIDPLVAVERVRTGDVDAAELPQLLLRLAPERRDEALAAALELRGQPGRALAYALGGERRRRLLDRSRAAWQAAEQARDPEALLAAAGFDLATPPRDAFDMSRWKATADPPALSPADDLDRGNTEFAWGMPTRLERWLALVSPLNRERFYGIGVRRLAQARDTQAVHGTDDIIAPLAHPLEPLGPAARRLVALAFGAAAVEHRAIAADVAIAALGDRRLDAVGLGGALAEVFEQHPVVVPSRWAAPLADVAAAGPVQAHDVQRALEAVLAVAGDDRRRQLVDVVELLRRLAIEGARPVADAGARAFLERVPPRSKTGRAARDALGV